MAGQLGYEWIRFWSEAEVRGMQPRKQQEAKPHPQPKTESALRHIQFSIRLAGNCTETIGIFTKAIVRKDVDQLCILRILIKYLVILIILEN